MTNETSLPPRIQALLNPEFVTPELTRENILNLPVNTIKGIGPAYRARLQTINVSNIQDLSEIADRMISEKLRMSIKLVEKFCLSARIIAYYVKFGEEQEKQQRKIVLVGLDSAGKTSIIQSIRNMETFENTTPTLGVKVDQFELVGKKISLWDLGGQATFRDVFTRPDSVQFSGLSLFIFVFDVQSHSRALEGLDYFNRSLKVASFLQQKPRLVIFFHKYDYFRGESALRVFNANKEHLLMRINILRNRYNLPPFITFDTTIYDIPCLIQAFSKALTVISPVASVLNDTLEFYSKEQNVLGTFLISETGMIIAEYTAVGKLEDRGRDDALIQAMICIRDNPDTQFFSQELENNLFITVEQMLINNIKLYLLTLSESGSRVEIFNPQALHEMLAPWITNLFASI
ncbi:MAG: ADP-ribosylation factor-like protein [Promethearchaeota archaeon]